MSTVQIADAIRTADDETSARKLLAPLTAAQLRDAAAALRVYHRAGDSKPVIVDLIVTHRVRRRLTSAAIARVGSLHG